MTTRETKRRRGRRALGLGVGALALLGGAVLYAKQPIWAARGTSRATPADPARLRATVEELVALGPRDVRSQGGLERAAAFVTRALSEIGARPEREPFEITDDPRTYDNVVARFGGAEGPLVIVGAHYDACGPLPGADDNASGVAALIELARLLVEAPPPGRVELVLYANEEPPHFATPAMGSVAHARAVTARGERVTAMLCLEMLGYFDDAEGSQTYPSPLMSAVYPSRGDFIAIVGNVGGGGLVRRVKRAMTGASSLSTLSMNAPAAIPGVDFSDHRSYWALGVPAVMITDTAFFRNPNYHTASDTPGTLDYDRMADVVAGVHAAVVELAAQ